ncbi:hypothetical protein AEST_29440 [Alishewanella aestuarii B11]|uniref:Uncharacterized protein n=1 Tax=Alishewanella aestuarii B11 TaxID=1197174 RepID=J1Y8N6_9ALTE|nr:hypothetical protein AEST_29440 [Alishewanella aestuarii B11]
MLNNLGLFIRRMDLARIRIMEELYKKSSSRNFKKTSEKHPHHQIS